MNSIVRSVIAALLIAAMLSCVHARRGPASTEEPTAEFVATCRSGLDDLRIELLEGIDGAFMARTDIEYLEGEFLTEFQKRLDHKYIDACERSIMLNESKFGLKGKREAVRLLEKKIDADVDEIDSRRSTLYLSEARFSEAVSCFMTCMNENPELSYEDRVKRCAPGCGMSEAYLGEFENSPIKDIASRCHSVVSGEVKFEAEVFRREFETFRSEIGMAFDERMSQISGIRFQARGLSQVLDRADESLRRAGSPQAGCIDRRKVMLNSIKNAVVRVRLTGAAGSGFYVNSSKGTRLITAYHVYDARKDKDKADPLAKIQSHKVPKGIPDSYIHLRRDRKMLSEVVDVIQSEAKNYRGKKLDLVREGTVPKVGQEFFIAGMPKIRKSAYVVYRCHFLGFDTARGTDTSAWHYVMSCFSPEGPLNGISGGPMVDATGVAWGLISGFNLAQSLVYIAPVSLSESGRVIMGIQKSFSSENCYVEGVGFTETCRIGPPQ